ncbi:hypothetical protein CW751_08990 [Brumimicrobium salinarum]|uniref:VWFA domain-containing protein n=1 Tax=Brumimicrobium salinarum TaxID=2058658 RepID=A0A2I0R1N4_9FLAO|nr:hypothetical protein [Brumimicrobium salinarum]PKR80501.1 hypothetical protein CW751_08990 [Brumimicrobium salinarum]
MKTLFFIPVLFFSTILFSQSTVRTVDDIIDQREKKSGIYRISGTYLNTAVVNMNYGKAEILSVMNKKELKTSNIIQIDLVYTNYPKGEDISALNKQRILNMLSIRPDLIKAEGITWSLVRQMYCKNEAQAKLMFHGAVIYYKPNQDQEMRKIEQKNYQSLPKDDSKKITEKDLEKEFRSNPVVINAFKRNKWEDPVIVADVTGSMYPYMRQVAFWFLLKMNKKEETYIALFNDGDRTPNDEKIIGRTGGIYTIKTKDYSQFRDALLRTVSLGNGGDTPENDVEALYKAQRDNPEAEELILIADNLADMRDQKLISKIKKPVRIILCGTKYRINIQYLNLAFATGGSIHTLKEDLNDLINQSEGDTFEFLGKKYTIKDGEVVERQNRKKRI